MLAELWTYIVALISNWASLIWGTSLIFEVGGLVLRKTQYLVISDWLDRNVVAEETRVTVLRTLLVVGLLIAGFNAWTEQYQIAIAKSPEALTSQVAGLKEEIEPLKQYKEKHEVEERPALNAEEQQEWIVALSPVAAKVQRVEITETEPGSKFLVDSLMNVLTKAGFPQPNIYPTLSGEPDGIVVDGGPKEAITTLSTLFSVHLKDQIPAHSSSAGNGFLVQILIGRHPRKNADSN